MKKTASALVVAVLPVMLLAPAAEGQEPQPTSATQFECATAHGPDHPMAIPEYQRVGARSTGTARIDVLALHGNPDAYSDSLIRRNFHSVASAFVYAETGIDLRLVGVEPVPADIASAVERMLRNITGSSSVEVASEVLSQVETSESVDELRRRFGADVVVVFTPGVLSGRAFGLARVPRQLDRSVAFSLISSDYGEPYEMSALISHEIGHTLGLAHQEDDYSPPLRPYGRAYVYESQDVSYSTIMAQPQVGFPLGAFSRDGSFETFTGETLPLGDADHDSARALRDVGHAVAAYEQEKPTCGAGTCLLQARRFRVKAWYLLAGDTKSRAAVALGADVGASAGLFTFDSGEPELLVRISDQCEYSDHYAVYVSVGTDAVRHNVAVRDTATNELRWFRGRNGEPVTDSAAFRCEP